MWQEGFGHMGNVGWGWAIVGFIHMAIVWIVIALLIFGAVRLVSGRGVEREQGRESALDVLERRYARGEIDRQEFEERKAVLRGSSR